VSAGSSSLSLDFPPVDLRRREGLIVSGLFVVVIGVVISVVIGIVMPAVDDTTTGGLSATVAITTDGFWTIGAEVTDIGVVGDVTISTGLLTAADG